MNHQDDIQVTVDYLVDWTDNAADVMNRIIDRLDAITVKLGDLSSRVDEWDVRQ
jgi:hypothetical protein